MINYISAKHCSQLIKITDNDFTNPVSIDYFGSNIDWAYYIPKDGKLNGIDVKEGDIVYVMYGINNEQDREVIVITDPKLKDYYTRLLKKRKKDYENRCASDCCEGSVNSKPDC